MPRLIWTPQALRDVQRLVRFWSETNIEVSKRVAKSIRDGVGVIALQPAVGRPVDGMGLPFREWLIAFGDSGYVVLYRIDGEAGDNAVILAVRHQREAGY